MKTFSTSLFASACVASASAAQALPSTDRLSVELFAGGNVSMPGSFRGRSLPFESPAGATNYQDLKLDDAYAHRLSGGAELDHAIDDHLATFASATYNEFSGDRMRVGQFNPSTGARRSAQRICQPCERRSTIRAAWAPPP